MFNDIKTEHQKLSEINNIYQNKNSQLNQEQKQYQEFQTARNHYLNLYASNKKLNVQEKENILLSIKKYKESIEHVKDYYTPSKSQQKIIKSDIEEVANSTSIIPLSPQATFNMIQSLLQRTFYFLPTQ